MMNTK